MTKHFHLGLILANIFLLGLGCRPQQQPQSLASQKTYTNTQFGYEISYPQTFSELNAMSEAADLALNFPAAYTEGTNLGEAHIITTAHVGLTSSTAPKCLTNPYTGVLLTQTVMQGGEKFYTYDIDDAGAGQRYFYRAYQTFRANVCYTVLLQLHSSAIENFDEAQRPRAYDHGAVLAAFDKIFTTLTFQK